MPCAAGARLAAPLDSARALPARQAFPAGGQGLDSTGESDASAARGRRRGARVAPLYHQLYVLLREALEAGRFAPGEKLPSEPSLAARFAVSRITVRRTLAQLAAEGLVHKIRGVGTFPKVAAPGEGPANISGYLENLISFDRSTTADLLDWRMVDCPEALKPALGCARALRITRLRRHRARPISHTTLHVPEGLAGLLYRATAGDTPVIQLLEDAGVIAERTEQAITAVAAERPVAERLAVASGSPLIAMRRLMRQGDGSPVLHQESLYAPDLFEYRMMLTRTAVGPAGRWTPIA
jgi:GntR family transcriptional regulator